MVLTLPWFLCRGRGRGARFDSAAEYEIVVGSGPGGRPGERLLAVRPRPVRGDIGVRELGPSGRRDLASPAAVVGEPGPCEGGILEPRMTSLQPLLELDRHKHAHLAGLVDP